MSLVSVEPEALVSAGADLTLIDGAIRQANAAAATPTTAVLAAAGDDVSTAIAALFSNVGKEYQALSIQAAAFHEQFVQNLTAGIGSYGATEAANTSPLHGLTSALGALPTAPYQTLDNLLGNPALQPVEQVINAPTDLLLGDL